MQPVRVLHVFGGLDAGGAESRTMDIYRQIDRSKVQFDFLIHTTKKGFFEEEIMEKGGRIYRVPRFGLKTLLSYSKDVDDFFEAHPEYKIIHGHMLSTAFIYLKIAKKRGIPVRIAHSRSASRAQKNIVNIIKNTTDKLSRFYATHLFAVSKLAGVGSFGKRRVESEKVKIIRNAINTKKYIYNEPVRKKVRDELNLKDALVVGHVGRFSPQKNHLFLLDIFNEMQKKQPLAKLVLIGDGPMKTEVNTKIKELDLENNVLLLGIRDDVNNILQAMDVLLFPSTHEGLPGVVLEAQAAGLPCVISSSITKEVNITELVKYISLDKDVDIWASKTIETGNRVKRENTHQNIVEAGFDIKSVAKQYERFYLNGNSSSFI